MELSCGGAAAAHCSQDTAAPATPAPAHWGPSNNNNNNNYNQWINSEFNINHPQDIFLELYMTQTDLLT